MALKHRCKEEFGLFMGDYISKYAGERKLWEYYGDCKLGEPHGRGIRCYPSGAEYFGTWEKGVEHSTDPSVECVFTWASGATYVGSYVRGKRHGFGTKTSADGKTVRAYVVSQARVV